MKPLSALILFILITSQLHSQPSKKSIPDIQWPAYGGDAGGSRYSPLEQINISNVSKLKPVWTYQTGELKTYAGTSAGEKAAFEATPLMVDGTLFFSTPSCRVIAIDAVTGKEKWVYDPQVNLKKGYSEITSRGVSVWPADNKKQNGGKKVFIGTIDGRLIALDAGTGKPIPEFGKDGAINLSEGMRGDISVTSPPAVIGNLIIIGSSMGDNHRFDYPRGAVRAFDVHTGQLRWTWDPVPQDSIDKAWKTWNGPKAHQAGAANAWSILSVDPQRDLVFVPTSCPSPDYYGGERLGQNLYGNSIVALKASTGKLIWYYQVVHHDIWDYDIAAQPMLIEINKNGKKVPAVAVGTKMGHIFILDRLTGKPLFPIEEKPMPASLIPGEQAWKTQPVPVLPAPVGIQTITKDEAWGLTEPERVEAANKISKYRNEGPFTPASFEGTLVTPGNVGGIHWGGMCFDQKQGILITNINRIPAIIRLIKRDSFDQVQKDNKELVRAETGMQLGTPYILKRDYLFKITMAGMTPEFKPPWGTLLAINTNDGSKKWEVPLGFMLDPKKYAGADKWGSINFGGAIVTAGNLIFVAATMDNNFRAFNTKTGEMVWEYQLPASAQATPMTYSINGKQYLVIAAGGHGKLHTKLGDYVVAFAVE